MQRPNLYDRLKVIAILTMIVDHVGYVFFPELTGFRLVGRIAFPIFLFLVGFSGSYNWRRDLLTRAIIVQIPIFILSYWFGFGSLILNILFGIAIGRVALKWIINSEKLKIKNKKNENLEELNKSSILKDTSSFLKGGQKLMLLVIITIGLLLAHPWLAQLWDYGSFVILLPLIGYLMRKVKSVKGVKSGNEILNFKFWILNLNKIFVLVYSIVIFAFLFRFTRSVFGFSLAKLYILAAFFVLILCIFFALGQANYFLPVGKKFDRVLLFLSKNALLIYVFHLLALGVLKLIFLGVE